MGNIISENRLTDQTGHYAVGRPQADGEHHLFDNGYPTH
jgi:hypothetical protein